MRASVLWALTTLTFACADRAGISTTTLTPAGGGLRSADGLFSIEIPEGALAEDAEVTITIRDDILATDLTSRIYEVSAVELVPNAVVTVRYRAPRTPWIGRRGMATFDEGRVELATDFDYDHLEHVASAVYESLDRRQFGLATTVETELPCSPGCLRGTPGCMIDTDARSGGCGAEGWSDPPNTGLMFVVNSISVAPEERGFDIDGRCRGPGDCVDNALGQLGQLLNDQIRQALLGGERLTLVELSGVDHPGDLVADGSLTVKFYDARDFDDPFFPANNYSTPAGDTRCCEFLIDSASLDSERRNARARLSARLVAGAVSSDEVAEVGLWGWLPALSVLSDDPDMPPETRDISLRGAQISFQLEVGPRFEVVGLTDGVLGGAVLARELAATPNPFCKTLNNLCPRQRPDPNSLELALMAAGPPDVDLGGDGFETFRVGADGAVSECIDGDGTVIPPLDPDYPASCARSSRVDDAYSVAYHFSAKAAKVKGVTPAP